MTKQVNRHNQDSAAIVFDGPVNYQRRSDANDAIHFPTDDDQTHHYNDDNINLSFTFTPMSKPNVTSQSQISSGVYAICGSSTIKERFVATSSNSGVFTYHNGTQIFYANCQIFEITHTTGS